ncbi:MAG: hypothetical protein ACPGJV_05895 [Bacteriovoracaceae bacterium]
MLIRGFILLFLFVLGTSCGLLLEGDVIEGETRQFDSTDAAIQPYVESFEKEGRNYLGVSDFKVGDIPINFGETPAEQYDGVCIKYPNGTREILLKKSWWNNASETQKEIIVFHELGHCRLNRKHNEVIYENDSPEIKISLMASIVPYQAYYTAYREDYLRELFKADTKSFVATLNATYNNDDDE